MTAEVLPLSLSGRWWNSPQMVQKFGLTPDQQKKMEEVFQQNRLKLIDLTASLDKEDVILEQMLSAEPPDAAKIRLQIDKVAQARAELEKANANMLLGIRLLLTPAQWKTAQAGGMGPRPRRVYRPEDDQPRMLKK
jgi:Spy/CpxP family protein refolding chaperone